MRKWRAENPEKAKAASRRDYQQSGKAWREQNRARVSESRRDAYKERGYWQYIERAYGLTRDDYELMVIQQGGMCAICGTHQPSNRWSDTTNRWHVDHCHSTGRVRGLLCFSCNGGLGHFKDDLRRMKAAVAYLERHAGKA